MKEGMTNPAGAQDTGNPVLDSMVNLVSGSVVFTNTFNKVDLDFLTQLHQTLVELAAKEPGGLRRHGKEGVLLKVEKEG